MSSLGLGEVAGEFTDVTGADQLARGGVTAGRHGPVIAGCAAAPHPPLRVLAHEPVKVGILIVPAWAGRHGGRRSAAGGRLRCWRPGRAGAWMAGFSMRLPPDGAICRVIPSQAGGWWRAVRAWPTGAGRDDAAVPPRQPSRVLSGWATGQAPGGAAPAPDSGPGPSREGQRPECSQPRGLPAR